MKKVVHVSVGDINGISLEIIIRAHHTIKNQAQIYYHLDPELLNAAAEKLDLAVPADINFCKLGANWKIQPGLVSALAGNYSFLSFKSALLATMHDSNAALVNLPINKQAWQLAGHNFLGHTAYFRNQLLGHPQMMLGGPDHYVVLFSDHVPLSAVPKLIRTESLLDFMLLLYKNLGLGNTQNIGVLGLNPHAGEQGLLGHEEEYIALAINKANLIINQNIFRGPFSADAYFANLSAPSYTLAMYHDQGLIAVKTMAFKQAIQVSLGLPFKRASVAHGSAFDIAYSQQVPDITSYQNAVIYASRVDNI